MTSLDQNVPIAIISNIYILGILGHFDTKNNTLRFAIIQNLYEFFTQNVSISPDQNMSQEAKCFNTPKMYTTDEELCSNSYQLGYC